MVNFLFAKNMYREWQKRGDEALEDNRHGHAYKATAEVKQWLVERSEAKGAEYSPQLVAEIKSRFEMELHHDYVNLLRNQLGLPAPKAGRPDRKEKEKPASEKNLEKDFSP